MEVRLLSSTNEIIDIIHTACRTCYSKQTPIEIYNKNKFIGSEDMDISCEELEANNQKKIKLIQKVMDSGHLSTAEHAHFTFAICGVSRALMAQITRHRLASFSIQSQRYVEIKEDLTDIQLLNVGGTHFDKIKLLSKYFVLEDDNNFFINSYMESLITYLKLIKEGKKAEDARNVLPQATKTNIVLSCNLRELIHICNLRLCKHAQLEIRTVVGKMKDEVLNKPENKWLAKYLVSNCKHCTDFRDCKGAK